MRKIIITVKDFDDSFSCDMEIPADVPVAQIAPLIFRNAAAVSGDISFTENELVMLCKRTSAQADLQLTAEENGIRNGDYLILIER